jgi:anti-anti-sigma factor
MASALQQGDVTIVEMDESYNALDEGPIDALSDLLLAEVEKAPDPPRIVLDFSNTTYISSRVLEVLFRIWKRLKERQGKMIICSVQPFCGEVLQITHLDRIWHLAPDRKTALEEVRSA